MGHVSPIIFLPVFVQSWGTDERINEADNDGHIGRIKPNIVVVLNGSLEVIGLYRRRGPQHIVIDCRRACETTVDGS